MTRADVRNLEHRMRWRDAKISIHATRRHRKIDTAKMRKAQMKRRNEKKRLFRQLRERAIKLYLGLSFAEILTPHYLRQAERSLGLPLIRERLENHAEPFSSISGRKTRIYHALPSHFRKYASPRLFPGKIPFD